MYFIFYKNEFDLQHETLTLYDDNKKLYFMDSDTKWIRIVMFPLSIYGGITRYNPRYCELYDEIMIKPSKVIVSDRYYLYDIKTIKKIKFLISRNYVCELCKLGKVDILEYLLQTKYVFHIKNTISPQYKNDNKIIVLNDIVFQKMYFAKDRYTLIPSQCIDLASEYGNVDVLEWWFKSGLPFSYSSNALDTASIHGHINVLEWWLKSNLPLKYTNSALDGASANGHVNVLEWWKKSKLELKYSSNAMEYASGQLIYRNNLNFDSLCGHINVLEWWKHSGLKLKYSKNIIKKYSKYKYHPCIVEWWTKTNLDDEPIENSFTYKQL
jgi:hypothetical protein